MSKDTYLRKEDEKFLGRVVEKIKKLPYVYGIIQVGSSVYSKNYNDVDIIVFFHKVLPPPEMEKINKECAKHKFWIEGEYVEDYKIMRGMKVFAKFFSNIRAKKVLYGRNPYQNKEIALGRLDVANYLWYRYHMALFGLNAENVLPVSLNAMLAYKDIFPQKKRDSLVLFKKAYPSLAKFLPKNSEYYLRNTNKTNFKELYRFFQESISSFSK